MYNGIYDIEQFAYLHDSFQKWLRLKMQNNSIGKVLKDKGIRSVAIYGVNDLGKMVYEDICQEEIAVACFIDKKYKSYPEGYDGIPVIGSKQLFQVDSEVFILITPEFYFCEIVNDLLEGGTSIEKILSLSMVV